MDPSSRHRRVLYMEHETSRVTVTTQFFILCVGETKFREKGEPSKIRPVKSSLWTQHAANGEDSEGQGVPEKGMLLPSGQESETGTFRPQPRGVRQVGQGPVHQVFHPGLTLSATANIATTHACLWSSKSSC